MRDEMDDAISAVSPCLSHAIRMARNWEELNSFASATHSCGGTEEGLGKVRASNSSLERTPFRAWLGPFGNRKYERNRIRGKQDIKLSIKRVHPRDLKSNEAIFYSIFLRMLALGILANWSSCLLGGWLLYSVPVLPLPWTEATPRALLLAGQGPRIRTQGYSVWSSPVVECIQECAHYLHPSTAPHQGRSCVTRKVTIC